MSTPSMHPSNIRRAIAPARRLGLLLPLLALLVCSCSSDGGGAGPAGDGFDDSTAPTINYFPDATGYAVGFNLSLAPGVTGSPKSFQVISGVLPPGISFHKKSGTFSGRPLTPATTPLVVRATNALGFADTSVDLQITPPPAARFLYAANTADDRLSAYLVDAISGALRNVGFAPAGDEPRVVSAAPGGEYVAVGASVSGDVSIFAIHAMHGRPSEVATSPTAVGSAVTGVAFHPGLVSLYVLAADDGTKDLIFPFSFDATTGALTSLSPTPYSVPDGGTALVADPLGRALYLAHGAGLRSFGINPSGTLVDLGDVNVSDSFQGIAVLPGGSSAYAVNLTQTDVYRFPIGVGGTLSPGSSAANLAGSMALGLAISGDGSNLYIADGAGALEQFGIGLGGSLSALAPATVSVGSGLAGLATSPAGSGAWASRTGVNELVTLSAGVGGVLTAELETPVRAHQDPRGLALAPALNAVDLATKNLFATNFDNDDVSQYAIGLGGVMGPLFPPTALTGSKPVSVEVHPFAEALYVCNEQDTTRAIEVFSLTINGPALPLQEFAAAVGASSIVVGVNGEWAHAVMGPDVVTLSVAVGGTLTAVAGTPPSIPVTGRPARHPSGRWLYLPDGAAGTVDTYSVDQMDGSLTSVDSDTADLGVNAVAVDPTGRFLYAVNDGAGTDQVRGFAIDATDGTLSELSTSPYAFDAMAKDAIDVVVHPSGRLVYVATRDNTGTPGEGSIHVYSIEVAPLSGASFGGLTLSGSPTTFPLEAPSAIGIDASGTTLYVSIQKVLSRIEAYSLDAGGALSVMPVDIEDSGAETRDLALRSRAL